MMTVYALGGSGRGAPQFQQSVNCDSMFSPHFGHVHVSPLAVSDSFSVALR
jgi:hypothetical protein